MWRGEALSSDNSSDHSLKVGGKGQGAAEYGDMVQEGEARLPEF